MPARSQRRSRLVCLHRRAVRYRKCRNRHRLFDLVARHPEIGNSLDLGCSFLERAIWWHDHELAEWLLEHGADPNLAEAGTNTPLIQAAFENDVRMAGMLLDAGALIDEPNSDDETPLGYACAYDLTTMVQFLCERGADVNRLEGHQQWHYLYSVRCAGQKEIERILLAFGAQCEFFPQAANASAST